MGPSLSGFMSRHAAIRYCPPPMVATTGLCPRERTASMWAKTSWVPCPREHLQGRSRSVSRGSDDPEPSPDTLREKPSISSLAGACHSWSPHMKEHGSVSDLEAPMITSGRFSRPVTTLLFPARACGTSVPSTTTLPSSVSTTA